jgi:hypothetical protein
VNRSNQHNLEPQAIGTGGSLALAAQQGDLLQKCIAARDTLEAIVGILTAKGAGGSSANHTKGTTFQPPLPRNVFKNDGEIWTIEFLSGETPERKKYGHLEGYTYLATLVRNQGTAIRCLELDGCPTAEIEAMYESFQPTVETAQRPGIRRRLEVLKKERDKALKDGATARVKELDGSIKAGQEYLDDSENPHDKPTGLGAPIPATRIRRKVYQALLRAYDHLGKHTPLLCRHLRSSIKWDGLKVVYAPTTLIEWDCG